MDYSPHPIIPELLALQEKHGATILGHDTMEEFFQVRVAGKGVFVGCDLDDLREAAAECQSPAAKTCRTCSSWHPETVPDWYESLTAIGICGHPRVSTATVGEEHHDDSLIGPNDDSADKSVCRTGPDFGCIHHSTAVRPAAAAHCPQPPAAPHQQLEALLTKHQLAIVPMGDEWCAFLPAPGGGFSVKVGYIDVTDMDADGRGATPLEAARNALEKT